MPLRPEKPGRLPTLHPLDTNARGPMKRILDRSFRYVPAVETDVRKTFARERKRLAEQKQREQQIADEAQAKVRKLGGRDPK